MIRGLYAAAAGMVAQMEQQDTLANNLANVSTPGFRRQQPVVAAFTDVLRLSGEYGGPAVPDGAVSPGAGIVEAMTDLAEGLIHETGNPLDLAISGDGFFVVQGDDGVTRYTRNGHFALNTDGELVTLGGERVMGTAGPIRIEGGAAAEISVGRDGTIIAGGPEGRPLGQLRVVTLSAPEALRRAEGSRLEGSAVDADPSQFAIQQGCIEESNVNPISEMGQMIRGVRLYQANARAMQYQDETLHALINVVS